MLVYDLIALIILPLILIQFSIDYLSDAQITDNETRIGILQFIHHIINKVTFIGSIFTLFLITDIKYVVLSVIVLMITQIGFLKNNDCCWYTRMVNTLIDPKNPNRKWLSDWESYVKHYIRGGEWAYSERFNNDATMEITVINIIYILILIKLMRKYNNIC